MVYTQFDRLSTPLIRRNQQLNEGKKSIKLKVRTQIVHCTKRNFATTNFDEMTRINEQSEMKKINKNHKIGPMQIM